VVGLLSLVSERDFGSGFLRKKQLLHQRARQLRREQTPSEAKLWQSLRGRQFAGCKFRRQFPVRGYIADFCCPERKLIIELDGEQHLEQQEYDVDRTLELEAHGYSVMRFWNNELVENMDGVMEAIFEVLNKPSP
jgi:very-short-patch-repair endonuclease